MKNKLISKIFILLSTLIFVSCLEVETTINISNNKSGVWILKYRIMQEASYITPGNELQGYNYFPVSEEELVNRIDNIAGLELISFSSVNTIFYTEFLTEMSFDSTNNIQDFFNNYTNNILFTMDYTEPDILKMVLNNPFPEADSTETINLITGLYSDKNISITVVLPGIVTESNQGLLSENPSEAKMNITLVQVFNITEPLDWIVKYE
ncbi:MAG: hypothetical protein KAH95_11885 [Spirochaetales bacterium]|nr:hypothetical protein [Spirochaetales bacterium]